MPTTSKELIIEFDAAATARRERQERWTAKRDVSLRAKRVARLKRLAGLQEAISFAATAYSTLPWTAAPVMLRSGFVYLDPARAYPDDKDNPPWAEDTPVADRRRREAASRPGSTALIADRGTGLSTYLSMIFVASRDGDARGYPCTPRTLSVRSNRQEPWVTLCGRLLSSRPARRARIRRDLDALAARRLVAMHDRGTQGRYEAFELLREDGNESRYDRPGPSEAAFWLPPSLFTNCWHLVLTQAELATYLALRHMANTVRAQSPYGWAVPERVRYCRYGLSDEAYESIHELHEFGLITIVDPMPSRRHGKVKPQPDGTFDSDDEEAGGPMPYLVQLGEPNAFERPALEIVRQSLTSNPLPPRYEIGGDDTTAGMRVDIYAPPAPAPPAPDADTDGTLPAG